MANNIRRGCGRSNNTYGCLNSVSGGYRWERYPYYGGPCPDSDGDDRGPGDECDCRRDRRDRCQVGIFTAMLPVAVAANGMIPLVSGTGMCGRDFPVNSGMVTLNEAGTYLASFTVRLPEGASMDSVITLNVNDASQATAVTRVGGVGPQCFTAQALFEVCDRATVTLRTSEAINLPQTSPQPLFTLTLVKIES